MNPHDEPVAEPDEFTITEPYGELATPEERARQLAGIRQTVWKHQFFRSIRGQPYRPPAIVLPADEISPGLLSVAVSSDPLAMIVVATEEDSDCIAPIIIDTKR